MNDISNLHNLVLNGKKIRELRENAALERADVGKRIGVGSSQIANIEQGIRKPSANGLLRLMLLYGVKPEDLTMVETN